MTIVSKAEDTGGWSAYDTDTCKTGAGETQREAIIDLTNKLGAAALDVLQRLNPQLDLSKPYTITPEQWDEAQKEWVRISPAVPEEAGLTKDRLKASVIIAALQHAADRGGVSIDLAENTVTFTWPLSDRGRKDAMMVFEAIVERKR